MEAKLSDEAGHRIDERKLIKTIIVGSDLEEVIANIIEEENINPRNIDIVRLVDAFMDYLYNLKRFDFRIPARFILVAAILLRMKCEVVEIKEMETKEEHVPDIDVNVPILDMPVVRRPKKRLTLSNLIDALNKAIEFEEKKKKKKIQIHRAVEALIEPEEDIEVRIRKVFDEIKSRHIDRFSRLVEHWEKKEIVDKFVPLLHLSNNGSVICEQKEMFGEIYISVCERG
ncbi:MAG: segregation/condensation protein A [Candidatus Aenigmarchaeota archaeon]|nr:segregation/condensation protein A [Candidatus Aenigmarchaeota archaeon]